MTASPILFLNPNMALDRVAAVHFREKSTLRPERFSLWAGGSGTHAAYVARLLGADVRLIGFAGGHTGALLRERLSAQDISADLVEIAGETRGTYSLLDVDGGNICDVAEASPPVTHADAVRFADLARDVIPRSSLVVVSGSVPQGFPASLVGDLVSLAARAQVPCIADLADELLRLAIPAHPWLVKPSRNEVAEMLDEPVPDDQTLLTVAAGWREQGVENVCISLDADGLFWVSPSGSFRLIPPAVPAYNPIGCGDTLVGALAASYVESSDLLYALRSAVAASAANLRYDVPGYCTPADVESLREQVQVVQFPHRV